MWGPFRSVHSCFVMRSSSPDRSTHDRIIEYDRQRPAYEGMSLSVLDKGHVTGSLATDRLREHVLRVLSTCDTDRVGRE